MFLGHYAIALASKRAAPRASFGVLIAAAQWPDLVWPLFLWAGWEQVRIAPGDTAFTPLEFVSYPISHSLVTLILWGFAAAMLYRRAARTVFACVLSHWVLDVVSHRPDMPLYPGGPRVGLGLWNSVGGTVAVEGLLFALAVWLYPGKRGRGFWALIGTLAALYVANVAGPPPPSTAALAAVALAAWLFPLWGWWVDRPQEAV